MAVWSPESPSSAERAAALHEKVTGRAPATVASAPATWVLIGENVDHFGGVTVVGLSHQRVSAAVSPRPDDVLRVTVRAAGGFSLSEETALASLVDAPLPAPTAPLENRALRRVAGLVQTLTSRQVLPRDTAGLDITIASDITAGGGLGALYAGDTALALALADLAGADELDEAPTRARLAEICSAAASSHSSLSILRARHTAALRGQGDSVCVIDYADGSVTHAPHPGKLGVRIFSVARSLGAPHGDQAERITARRTFIDDACTNFGVASLRQLPNAVERVVEWVEARREVSGPDTAPDPEKAREWVRYCETETLRSLAAAKALRSRRSDELFTLLNSPSEAHDIETPDDLVALALERGAVSARPAAAGMSQAVIAFVPLRGADAFLEAMGADFEVVEVSPGVVAGVDKL
ncbi:galactokinase [Corynebacterium qintianiae]|uniref:Galactokinase n=1 Tax=Corynebacterium qintianiae TaxID=2709392 RepID=A0A7T0PEF1_9CORY|nr:galactokinase family protein [Corynebacterium qintianiae]QPK82740.1 galactokinase [Corynebacterium qintianiae]